MSEGKLVFCRRLLARLFRRVFGAYIRGLDGQSEQVRLFCRFSWNFRLFRCQTFAGRSRQMFSGNRQPCNVCCHFSASCDLSVHLVWLSIIVIAEEAVLLVVQVPPVDHYSNLCRLYIDLAWFAEIGAFGHHVRSPVFAPNVPLAIFFYILTFNHQCL